jgi:acyl-CoA synthetase (AMP-forming)/AMP-acid ligase II
MPFPTFTASAPVFMRHIAEQYGNREMMVLNEQRLTYRQAEEQSRALAKGMLAAGIGKGTRVGILMPNGPDFVVTFMAATRIGALMIPLNTFYKPKELAFVLRHADIEVLLMVPTLLNNNYVERLEQCAPGLNDQEAGKIFLKDFPYLRQVYLWNQDAGNQPRWAYRHDDFFVAADHNQHIDDSYLEAVESCVMPADPMVIIYSSGSTSDPKGAIHSHGAVIKHSFNLNSRRDLATDDRLFSPMPFFWVGGLVFTLFCVLHKGACLICEDFFEPGKTLELLEKEKVTSVTGWPHYGKAMSDHSDFAKRDLSRIRAGNIYAIMPEGIRPKDPELRSNGLGMTETCSPHSLDMMTRDLPEHLRGSYGRALEGIEHLIIDPETGKVLGPNEQGELLVRGYNLMQGLYKVEREDTFDKDGFYHTDDGCYLNEDGVLFFKGRIGEMIKTGGANVTPREVEVLIDAQPEVQASFVVGLPDAVRGQNVAAVVVLNAGAKIDTETLKARLKEELSAYKVPKYFFFKEKSALPFTDSGKIIKKKLVEILVKEIS